MRRSCIFSIFFVLTCSFFLRDTLQAVISGNEAAEDAGNNAACSLDTIKDCFKVVRSSGRANWFTEEGIVEICPLIDHAFDCVDGLEDVCSEHWRSMQIVSYGIRNLERRICSDDNFRKEFVDFAPCFRSTGMSFQKCLSAFNHSGMLEAGCCENLGIVTCYERILMPNCPESIDFVDRMIEIIKERTYDFCSEQQLTQDCGIQISNDHIESSKKFKSLEDGSIIIDDSSSSSSIPTTTESIFSNIDTTSSIFWSSTQDELRNTFTSSTATPEVIIAEEQEGGISESTTSITEAPSSSEEPISSTTSIPVSTSTVVSRFEEEDELFLT